MPPAIAEEFDSSCRSTWEAISARGCRATHAGRGGFGHQGTNHGRPDEVSGERERGGGVNRRDIGILERRGRIIILDTSSDAMLML